jgi:hypothetical protein
MKIYSFFFSSFLVESQDVRTFKNDVCEEPTWMKVNGKEERFIQSQFPGQRNSQLEMKDQRCTFCGDDLVEMFKKRCCGASGLNQIFNFKFYISGNIKTQNN